MNEDATSTTYIMDGVEKLREAGYIGYENGGFIKSVCVPDCHHEWLFSDKGRWRFCIRCGKREHYSAFLNKWVERGEVQIKEIEM